MRPAAGQSRSYSMRRDSFGFGYFQRLRREGAALLRDALRDEGERRSDYNRPEPRTKQGDGS